MIELDEIELDEVVGTGLESNLIIWNDDYNTFEWVIACLITLLKHAIVLSTRFKGESIPFYLTI